jgi:O-antigen/teichoic acid export membrane protein
VSLIKKLVGQTAVYGLSSMVGRLLNYLLTPILTNYFAPDAFGINTEFYAYISFLNVLFTYGMETAYFRFCKQQDEGPVYTTGNSMLLISSLLFSSLLFLATPSINAKLHYEQYPYLMACMIGILFFDTLTTLPFARLRYEGKALQYAVLRLLSIGVNISATLLMVVVAPKHPDWFGSLYKPSIGIGYVFISNLLGSAIVFLYFLPNLIRHLQWPEKALVKTILPYALPLIVIGFAGMINETFDRLILNYLIPDALEAKTQIGIYGACYKLSIIITLFIQAFRMAAEPFFFQHSDKEDAPQLYAKVMHFFVAFCLVILFGTLFFMDYLQYFIGPKYRVGLQVVPILLVANLCLGIYYNLSIWYKLTNRTLAGSYITVAGAVITLIINFAFIPSYGYVASAWATLICYASMMLLSYIFGQRYYPIPYSLKKMGILSLLWMGLYGIGYYLVKGVYSSNGLWAFNEHGIWMSCLLFLTGCGITVLLVKPSR